MDPLLDELEAALGEVEEQLMAEFTRIRTAPDADDYTALDTGIKTALNEVAMHLWDRLENSGDVNNLSLRTERHETIGDRIIVVKKLLEAAIPKTFLEEVHRESIAVRQSSGPAASGTPDEPTRSGLLGSVKGLLGRGNPAQETTTTVAGTGQKSRGYTVAEHLAALARRFRTAGNERDLMQAVARGSAQFRSRELSGAALAEVRAEALAQTPEEIRRKLAEKGIRGEGDSSFASRDLKQTSPAARDIARTPEEIRRKLANAQQQTSGASRFEAKDLSGPATPPPTPSRKTNREAIAQSPEEIRRKLAERGGDVKGKASFAAKDVAHAATITPATKKDKPEKQEDKTAKPGGKAVFEAKDLSTPPPGKK